MMTWSDLKGIFSYTASCLSQRYCNADIT